VVTLSDERILVTGATGRIGRDLARRLARDNVVWGTGRFADDETRGELEALGVRPVPLDLSGDGGAPDLPAGVTVLVHLAAYLGDADDHDLALRVSAEGTGLVLAHCCDARAALVMSTGSVYRPHDDPLHAYREDDPLGDVNATGMPTYSVSKIAQEAVARAMARILGLPVTIARMNVAYGGGAGLPAHHLDSVLAGRRIELRSDPNPYSPIHLDDIEAQLPALLDAATVPATIVNWAGDEIVSTQEWCAFFGELSGLEPDVHTVAQPGTQPGSVMDVTRRRALTGPCRVGWRDGVRELFEGRQPVAADNAPRS
jgi:nucleoside-diphosphate-sugar epimerase